MKSKLLLAATLAFSIQAFSQPVIQNANNIPAPGLAAPISYGTATTGPGTAGASQTWDFSNIAFTSLGTLTTINPSTSVHASSFPTANFAYSFANTYSYFNTSSSKMEVMAYSITSPGSGNDYSPNPRTVLKFPFNFGNSETDTWQKTGGSTNNVTITYDGYGTLIMPSTTYQNVVRVKEDYGSGAIDYQWYILNPLMSILVYDHNSNAFYYTGATALGTTAPKSTNVSINVYPNPAKDKLTIELSRFPAQNNMKLNIMNLCGQVVAQVSIDSLVTEIDLGNIPQGVYVYQLMDQSGAIKTGKLVIGG